MFENLSHINPEKFSDPQVKEIMKLLLNVTELQQKQITELKQTIQELRDEIARLKGEQPKPKILPNTEKKDISSQKYQKITKEHHKESKKDKLTFDNTVICPLSKENLPSDLVYKGTRTVVQQDIIFKRNNTRFVIETWYSPSQNKTYEGALPAEYNGYFGNSLKSFCIVANKLLYVTQNRLIGFLRSFGIEISNGSLENILTQNSQMWIDEKNDLMLAGLGSPYLQMDSTGARVHGQNYKVHIFVCEFFTVFTTMPTKSRLDILRALQCEPENGLSLQYNETTRLFFEHYRISEADKTIVEKIFLEIKQMHQAEFETIIQKLHPELYKKTTTFKWIVESLAFGYYFEQKQIPVAKNILTDDAKEYKLLAKNHALCWVHDARYYNKLMPKIEYHHHLLEQFKEHYWDYYSSLKEYAKNPTLEIKNQLYLKFEEIFTTQTGYFDLDQQIKRTLSNKDQLLVVLEFPFVPLHNNAAELAARVQVRKRDISLHTMSEIGTKLQDAFLSILQTSLQLGINAYQYIHDRLNGKSEIYLPDVVLSKINMK